MGDFNDQSKDLIGRIVHGIKSIRVLIVVKTLFFIVSPFRRLQLAAQKIMKNAVLCVFLV